MIDTSFSLVIASEAKQSMSRLAETWIASSLSLLAMTSAGAADSHIKQQTHANILAGTTCPSLA
jgi:hypothetical protein